MHTNIHMHMYTCIQCKNEHHFGSLQIAPIFFNKLVFIAGQYIFQIVVVISRKRRLRSGKKRQYLNLENVLDSLNNKWL